MKMNKMTIVLLVGFLLLSGTFLWAGGQQEGTSEDSAATTKAEPIELSIWVENTTGNKDTFDNIISNYEENHPNVDVKPEVMTWGQLQDKLTTTFASGKSPDVVHLPAILLQQADRGMLLEVDQYVTQDTLSQFLDSAVEGVKWEGHYYGLPFISGTTFLMYNVNAFDEAGIPNPSKQYEQGTWDWDSFVSVSKKLNDPPRRYAFSTPASSYWTSAWILQSIEPSGNFLFGQDGELYINTSSGKRGFQFLLDLFHKEKIAAIPTPGADYAEATRTFATERSTMGALGAWDIGLIQDVNPELDFKSAPYPKGPNGTSAAQMSINTLAVGKYSENPDKAWELLTAMVDPEIVMDWTVKEYRGLSLADWSEHPFVQNDPYLSGYSIAMKNGVLRPYVPEIPDIETIVGDEMGAAIFQEKTMEEALKSIERRVEESKKLSE